MQLFLNLLFYHLHGRLESYSETYLLRILPFLPHFMDILPIIFTFSRGNVACAYHDFQQISAYHNLIFTLKRHHFFVHLGDIIAWSKGNVNQNLQWFVQSSYLYIILLLQSSVNCWLDIDPVASLFHQSEKKIGSTG